MQHTPKPVSAGFFMTATAALISFAAAAGFFVVRYTSRASARPAHPTLVAAAHTLERIKDASNSRSEASKRLKYQPRLGIDSSAAAQSATHLRWTPDSLEQARDSWQSVDARMIDELDRTLPPPGTCDSQRLSILISKVNVLNRKGDFKAAYELLAQTRSWVEETDALAELGLYTVIFTQGVTAMRRGETENCIMCRGESSCIIPIAPAAVHTNPEGSRSAIRHFTEYLEQFPDDLAVRWLLNLAHMTLGEYPSKVNPQYLVSLDRFFKSEFDIGKFRDVGEKTHVNQLGLSGGGVFEDFDNDGLLDLAITNYSPSAPMNYYKNLGDGTFEDRTKSAGLSTQLGGQTAIPTDFNNDGLMDIFISRGAWFWLPLRHSLLRNDGNGKFTDVTKESRIPPSNVHISRWADFDNDGWLDVFLVCEMQPAQLHRNRGDGTFEDVTSAAGITLNWREYCKGADWIDYDNDDYPDLFIDNMAGNARLYHNNRDGTFTNVTESMGIDGPRIGFSCWSWDYDNDGWLDIFATCYDQTLGDVVKGLIGQPHSRLSNRLWHNVKGKRFEDKTKEAGLDMVFQTMGSNFGDFDNDGFLDFYLGTGGTDFSSLVPNRMFKNVGGKRFADISVSSGTAHLQKGHSVSCADYDRDGDIDFFIQMGGAVDGDAYHNIIFQNPGQGNNWLTVKLKGTKSNRPAVGARIKLVTSGDHPLTVYRHVTTGSSWGCNPLQQTIGLARAERVALLEIHWPTTGTTQVFHDIAINQAIEITEFAKDYRKLNWKPLPALK